MTNAKDERTIKLTRMAVLPRTLIPLTRAVAKIERFNFGTFWSRNLGVENLKIRRRHPFLFQPRHNENPGRAAFLGPLMTAQLLERLKERHGHFHAYFRSTTSYRSTIRLRLIDN